MCAPERMSAVLPRDTACVSGSAFVLFYKRITSYSFVCFYVNRTMHVSIRKLWYPECSATSLHDGNTNVHDLPLGNDRQDRPAGKNHHKRIKRPYSVRSGMYEVIHEREEKKHVRVASALAAVFAPCRRKSEKCEQGDWS
jgi:hypothetical protein